jgi:hypothetical protein
MSISGKEKVDITISRFLPKEHISEKVWEIAAWCIAQEITFAIVYEMLEVRIVLDAEIATLAKLRFPM